MSIEIKNLTFSYDNRVVLDDISSIVEPGKLTSLIGPNGVGKSTLFKCILGIIRNYKGDVIIDNKNIKDIKINELSKMISYVPQSHYSIFNYSVCDMVLMGMTSQLGFGRVPEKEHITVVKECLNKVGILKLIDRNYIELSGGEQQLVLIARALSQNSKILIMDEPTSNMDYGNQLRVMQQVKNLTKLGYTVLQSTHNPDQAFMFSDRVIALKEGKIIGIGTPKEVMSEEVINNLYDVNIRLESLYNDRLRVCIPRDITGE